MFITCDSNEDAANLTEAQLQAKYLDKLVRWKRKGSSIWHDPGFVVAIGFHHSFRDRIYFRLDAKPHAGGPRPSEGFWFVDKVFQMVEVD